MDFRWRESSQWNSVYRVVLPKAWTTGNTEVHGEERAMQDWARMPMIKAKPSLLKLAEVFSRTVFSRAVSSRTYEAPRLDFVPRIRPATVRFGSGLPWKQQSRSGNSIYAVWPLKGRLIVTELAVSLKRYPGTNLEYFGKL
jgi:hypothetical protein